MVVLDDNFALGCGPGTDYTYMHIFQRKLERRDATTNEVLKPITFVLAYPTLCVCVCVSMQTNHDIAPLSLYSMRYVAILAEAGIGNSTVACNRDYHRRWVMGAGYF